MYLNQCNFAFKVCRIKFCNSLPDIPFDPKFVAFPFEPTRYNSILSLILNISIWFKGHSLLHPDLNVVL